MLKNAFFFIFLILDCFLEIPIERVEKWDSSLVWFVKLGVFPIGVFDVWERDEKIAICFVFRGCWVWESMSAMTWGEG